MPAPTLIPSAASTVSAPLCPFHNGIATLDLLLAEIDVRDVTLFDAVLDLRSVCAAGDDAAGCIEQLFRVRTLLGERHYLAFYRVRCWARQAFRIEVRAQRGSPWLAQELPLDGGRLDEIVKSSLAALAEDGVIPAAAHLRFVFAAT